MADIGNTHFHSYDGERVEHLSYAEAIERYADTALCYISVKHDLEKKITQIKQWQNISDSISIDGEYETMGVDRKALCLSHDNGVFVDAGSAITVDVVEGGRYRGGFILPGIRGYLKAYKDISPALDTALDKALNLTHLPCTTKEQISYGIIASIQALIEKHSKEKQLYFTGGDGRLLASFFKDAIYDDTLVFKGMVNALKSEELRIKN